jgi:hypothetical protein
MADVGQEQENKSLPRSNDSTYRVSAIHSNTKAMFFLIAVVPSIYIHYLSHHPF